MKKEKYYLIVDFEMCLVKGNARKNMRGQNREIIQLGAVMLDKKHRIVDAFSSYVKPQYGVIDDFIEQLTGIKQEYVETAPNLRTVLMIFAEWLKDRDVVVLSWSDSDYHQLQNEMRIKKIKHHRIQDLLDEWVDFQRSFDQMLGLKKLYALEAAMNISRMDMMGKVHDGLCDAYNTARLFVKVQRQSMFSLEFVPIKDYVEAESHLSFSLGELFTPEILAQISEDVREELTLCEEVQTNEWSIWRKIYAFFKGKDIVTDEHWNKILFSIEMKKIDFMDWFNRIGINQKVICNKIMYQ